MKKLNYFEVHRNKKPKSIKQKPFDVRNVYSAMVLIIGLMQNEIIKSQVGVSPIQKALCMAENTIKTAEAISNIYKSNNKFKK